MLPIAFQVALENRIITIRWHKIMNLFLRVVQDGSNIGRNYKVLTKGMCLLLICTMSNFNLNI